MSAYEPSMGEMAAIRASERSVVRIPGIKTHTKRVDNGYMESSGKRLATVNTHIS